MSQLKQADQQQLDKRLICSLSQCTDESLNPDVSEISLREIVCWPEGKWNSRCSLSNTISWPDLERPRNRRRLLLIASASVIVVLWRGFRAGIAFLSVSVSATPPQPSDTTALNGKYRYCFPPITEFQVPVTAVQIQIAVTPVYITAHEEQAEIFPPCWLSKLHTKSLVS